MLVTQRKDILSRKDNQIYQRTECIITSKWTGWQQNEVTLRIDLENGQIYGQPNGVDIKNDRRQGKKSESVEQIG